jgi:septum formation protein
VTVVPRIILASASSARIRLLTDAGIAFEARPAPIDERDVEEPLIKDAVAPAGIAEALAAAKALAFRDIGGDALVVGADQVLDCDGRRWTKPGSLAEAKAQLEALAGRTHRLHSAVAAVRSGAVVWRHIATATMTMRSLSPQFVDLYLARVGAAALTSVGAYQIEGPGIQLFEEIEGDYFAILGLPLLPLLAFLRRQGEIEG